MRSSSELLQTCCPQLLVLRKTLIILVLLTLVGLDLRAQFTDSSTGLLQMPSGTMQENGTFMITNNFLNSHSLPSGGWGYNTFAYGINLTFWKRLEVGYVCTIFNGKLRKSDPNAANSPLFNQDRHFLGRFMLLQEGEFGWNWLPSLVLGVSDPSTGGRNSYLDPSSVSGSGNGYFNRMYAVMAKHFSSPWGELVLHAGYQINSRSDYYINAPCVGIEWKPVWIKDIAILDNIDIIAEYDSRTFNIGTIASIWDNRFEAMLELQNLRWVNFGLRYKLRLR